MEDILYTYIGTINIEYYSVVLSEGSIEDFHKKYGHLIHIKTAAIEDKVVVDEIEVNPMYAETYEGPNVERKRDILIPENLNNMYMDLATMIVSGVIHIELFDTKGEQIYDVGIGHMRINIHVPSMSANNCFCDMYEPEYTDIAEIIDMYEEYGDDILTVLREHFALPDMEDEIQLNMPAGDILG